MIAQSSQGLCARDLELVGDKDFPILTDLFELLLWESDSELPNDAVQQCPGNQQPGAQCGLGSFFETQVLPPFSPQIPIDMDTDQQVSVLVMGDQALCPESGEFTETVSQAVGESDSTQQGVATRRTSQNKMKPVFTVMKKLCCRLDNSFNGFFKHSMKKSMNSPRLEHFQWFSSFAQFCSLKLDGLQTDFKDYLLRQRKAFDKIVLKYTSKKDHQRASETKDFVDLLYKAILQGNNYIERMAIMSQGRKHDASVAKVAAKRAEFQAICSKS